MGTKTGLNGITFGDATVQNTAAVTGVSSAVAGSGISVSGSTGAVTFTNSGVTSIVAGTGISVSGATGAVTVTASGGGTVTSVATNNGLTGGTITTSGTIGIDVYNGSTRNYASYAIGTTVLAMTNATGGGGSVNASFTVYSPSSIGNTTYSDGSNGTGSSALAGTWRNRGSTNDGTNSYNVCTRTA